MINERDLGYDRLYIVELERGHVLSLAQMLHLGIALNPSSEVANETLDKLALQSDGVFRNRPDRHKVFDSQNAPPEALMVREGIYYIPFEPPSCK